MKQIKDNLFLPKLLKDILNVVYWFIIIFLGVALLFISWAYISGNTEAGNLFIAFQYSFPVSIDFKTVGNLMIGNSLYQASIGKLKGVLLLKDAPIGLSVFTITIVFFGSLLVLYMINLLRKVLKNISEGNQFSSKNGVYIRNIGIIVIIGSIFKPIVEILLSMYISANSSFENVKITTNIDLSSSLTVLFLGFVILVISQIFKLGYEIKSEQDLTV